MVLGEGARLAGLGIVLGVAGALVLHPLPPGDPVRGAAVGSGHQRFFSFRWHPYAVEDEVDYAAEPTTLVSFTLEEAPTGTRLTIVESGFEAVPESRRSKALTMSSEGRDGQAENIRKFLAA